MTLQKILEVLRINSEPELNELCLSCKNPCKQYTFATIIECPLYEYNGRKVKQHISYRQKSLERELPKSEKREIKTLVKQYANFRKEEQECLPLDSCCFMINKAYTGTLCKYFKNALLPLNLNLERVLTKNYDISQKKCGICGGIFNAVKNKRYCSDRCKVIAKKQVNRERARKYRNKGS